MTLSAEQIIILGLVATGIAQAVKWIGEAAGQPINRKWTTLALFVISLGLSFAWSVKMIPPLPVFTGDPMTDTTAILAYLGQILALLTPIVGFAMTIYNFLMERVFGALKNVAVKVFKKSEDVG